MSRWVNPWMFLLIYYVSIIPLPMISSSYGHNSSVKRTKSTELWIALLLITLSLFWGCTVRSISLKEQPSGVPIFSVQENYEVVFRRITRQARQCYEPRGRIIKANIFREELRAEVTISISYDRIERKLFTAEIKAESPSSTQVNTYYTYSPPGAWRDGAYAIQRWASSEEPFCGRH